MLITKTCTTQSKQKLAEINIKTIEHRRTCNYNKPDRDWRMENVNTIIVTSFQWIEDNRNNKMILDRSD
jgi:hypothetical protein